MILTKKLISQLILEAEKTKLKAYSPYSKFRVGASVLCKNGEVFTGCNVENLSYSLTNCAERTAIFNAVANGNNKIFAIVITSDNKNFTTPCGACLQVISEFSNDAKIILATCNGKIKITSLKKLLPSPPDLNFLKK